MPRSRSPCTPGCPIDKAPETSGPGSRRCAAVCSSLLRQTKFGAERNHETDQRPESRPSCLIESFADLKQRHWGRHLGRRQSFSPTVDDESNSGPQSGWFPGAHSWPYLGVGDRQATSCWLHAAAMSIRGPRNCQPGLRLKRRPLSGLVIGLAFACGGRIRSVMYAAMRS